MLNRRQTLFGIVVVASLTLILLLASCSGSSVQGHHDVDPPTVSIAGINEGEVLTADRGITVVASDIDSTIRELDFFVDGAQLFGDSYASYQVTESFTMFGTSNFAGPHTIAAQATDAAGNQSTFTVHYTVAP